MLDNSSSSTSTATSSSSSSSSLSCTSLDLSTLPCLKNPQVLQHLQSIRHHQSTPLPMTPVDESFCGWLWKRSGTLSRWKYHFFVLQGPVLAYYEKMPAIGSNNRNKTTYPSIIINSEGQINIYTNSATVDETCNPIGTLRVANVELNEKSKIALKIYSVSGKMIDLRTDTPEIRNRWENVLMKVALRYSRKSMDDYYNSLTATSLTNTSSFDDDIDAEENTATIDYINKQGWIDYISKNKTKKHYFVLQESMLAYYEDENPWTVPLARGYVVDINEITNTDEGNNSTSSHVQVTLAVGYKTQVLILNLEQGKDCENWKICLRKAKYTANEVLQQSTARQQHLDPANDLI